MRERVSEAIRTSIATVSISGILEEKLTAIAEAGFDGVEIFENDLVSCPLSPAEIRKLAADLGLRIELYQPFRDFEAVPTDVLRDNLRRAELKLDLMEQLGADLLLVCSNVSPLAIDDAATAAEQLHRLADLAEARGIRIAYEALAWGRHVRDYQTAYDIVAAAGHPSLGVCLDSFHILSRTPDATGIQQFPAEKIFFVQIADAPRLRMDALQWSRHYRCFPGQGDFDLPGFMRSVLNTGYEGPWSLEVFNDTFRQVDSHRTSVDAMRSLLFLRESLGDTPDPLEPPKSAPAASVRVASIPPPAPLTRYAFAEISVGTLMHSGLAEVLSGLGFVLARRHWFHPADLWEQGDIRIVTRRASATGPPTLSAIGVDTQDAAGFTARAAAFLAGPLPTEDTSTGREPPCVRSPDGTNFLACQGDAWLDDFVRMHTASTAPALLQRIDHVALSVPFGSFDAATLFFRTVFGLHPLERLELADPYGLVRSQALVHNDAVRLVVNTPYLGSTTHDPAVVQHIAFACTDIFAVTDTLRRNGVPLLTIPGNYYDDVAARHHLPESLIARMRASGILYDRVDGGEFFHVYTPLIGPSLFFEIVQRTGDYTGFGATNAPIRMAALTTSPPKG